jgi:hypothetical protein
MWLSCHSMRSKGDPSLSLNLPRRSCNLRRRAYNSVKSVFKMDRKPVFNVDHEATQLQRFGGSNFLTVPTATEMQGDSPL